MNSFFEKELEKKERKAREKLPDLFSIDGSLVPDLSIVEQASSSITARFVASLINEGEIVADLTSGLGVNTYFFSLIAGMVYAVEKSNERYKCLVHNLKLLEGRNIEVFNDDCINWLREQPKLFDTAYIDPARRNENQRFYLLKDYSPNVKEVISLLIEDNLKPSSLHNCSRLLIKVSPLLDITSLFHEIPMITDLYIIEVNREVKELILDIDLKSKMINESPFVSCVILKSSGESEILKFPFTDINKVDESKNLTSSCDVTRGFLYEPFPSIMKAGIFRSLSSRFPVTKLSKDTHLFYSEDLIDNFPGRTFKIIDSLRSADLKKITGGSYNVISRNHPAKAQEIENRYRLKSNDKNYLIACRIGRTKFIFSAEKVQ